MPRTQDDHRGLEIFRKPWELVFPDGSAFDFDVEASGAWTVTEVVGG